MLSRACRFTSASTTNHGDSSRSVCTNISSLARDTSSHFARIIRSFSENDLKIREKWEEVSRAKDEMFVHTDLDESPWYVVEADVKRHARLNMIAHLLSTIPYQAPDRPIVELPPRPHGHDYQRPPRELFRAVPDHAAALAK